MHPRANVRLLAGLAMLAAAFALHAGGAPTPAAAQDASSSAGSQLASADLSLAWQVTRGDPSVVVAVVDSGVQADHPALHGNVLPGRDLVNEDDDAADDNGHGTAVAGVIAGACPACRILPVKVLGADGTGDWVTIAAGIVWAADHGAAVINVSFGAPRAPGVVGDAVAYAVAKDAIVVAAAGNAGRSEPFYPAGYPHVVSVAGVDAADGRYSWSNYGGWVTVAAPGCSVTTWIGSATDADFCGTSAAAPFVAGVAGLARSYRSDLTPDAFAFSLGASSAPLADAGIAASGKIDANRLLLALGAPGAAPSVTAAPSVAAAPVVGRRVVARRGGWQAASTFALEWQRSCRGGAWQHVAAGPAYTPRRADRGCRLRVVVAASNARGSASASSAASARVAAP